MDGQIKKRRTLDAIKRIMLRESMRQPLMVIFEDLHWIDIETQALLNLLADSIATAKVLLLINRREYPTFSYCLYDVGRRKTRRHDEGIRHAIDASCDVDLVAFPIEAQFMICAEIDNHPGIARSRRPRLSPINSPTSVASRCSFLSSSSLSYFRAAETARARSSCFLRAALRSSCSLELIISKHYIDKSTGISI